MTNKKIYSFLLTTLIISQIGGLYGGALMPTRVLVLLYLPFCFNKVALNLFLKHDTRLLVLLFSVIGMSFILFMTSPTVVNINNFIYLIVNVLLVFEIVLFAKLTNEPYVALWRAWLIFICITIPIAFWEIFFDRHLSTSFLDEGQVVGRLGIQKKFAAVTFGNYNQYVFILVSSLPILLSRLLDTARFSKLNRVFLTVIIVCILFIVMTNGSRGGILAFILAMLIFVFFLQRKNKYNKTFYVKAFAATILLILFITYFLLKFDTLHYLLYRLETGGFEDNSRMTLIKAGFRMFLDSGLLGVGPGNFMNKLSQYRLGVRDLPPHNMFIELLAEYGLLIFLIFISILVFIYRKGVSIKTIHLKYIFVASLCSLPIIFTLNSVYVYVVYMWTYIGSLYVLSKTSNE